ncbi:signal peptide peptidase SppA [Rhizobiales bacterium GAS191]|nr:signal peptide peptidase SppA [Rhizobiales bacterium GAS188]SEC92903.1 signal peptide peptidase SppA [Rhizobiales bacterium GAS191]
MSERRFLSRLNPTSWRRRPTVGVVRLAGAIGLPWSARGGGLSIDSIVRPLERAFGLKNLKAVALAINSPGGSAVQSSLIAKRIRALAAEKNVPVLAFVEDVAASGGYWLATAGDEIYADESSIIGSIGVISAGFGFVDLLQRIGVERRVHTAGPRKAMLDPFRAEQPEDVTRLHMLQQEIHDNFKAQVRARRGSRLSGEEADLFGGEVWTARSALERGLIDGIGDLRTILRGRFGDKINLVAVTPQRNWLRRRLGLEHSEGFAEHVLATVEELALWSRYGL